MTISIIASVVRALRLVGEILHQCKEQVNLLRNLDRNSGRLWDVASAIEPVGMILGFTRIGRIQTGSILIALAEGVNEFQPRSYTISANDESVRE